MLRAWREQTPPPLLSEEDEEETCLVQHTLEANSVGIGSPCVRVTSSVVSYVSDKERRLRRSSTRVRRARSAPRSVSRGAPRRTRRLSFFLHIHLAVSSLEASSSSFVFSSSSLSPVGCSSPLLSSPPRACRREMGRTRHTQTTAASSSSRSRSSAPETTPRKRKKEDSATSRDVCLCLSRLSRPCGGHNPRVRRPRGRRERGTEGARQSCTLHNKLP